MQENKLEMSQEDRNCKIAVTRNSASLSTNMKFFCPEIKTRVLTSWATLKGIGPNHLVNCTVPKADHLGALFPEVGNFPKVILTKTKKKKKSGRRKAASPLTIRIFFEFLQHVAGVGPCSDFYRHLASTDTGLLNKACSWWWTVKARKTKQNNNLKTRHEWLFFFKIFFQKCLNSIAAAATWFQMNTENTVQTVICFILKSIFRAGEWMEACSCWLPWWPSVNAYCNKHIFDVDWWP